MSLWRCHLKNWWKVYSSFPLQKQLMRSPGENMRLWDLNWEIESSGRNAHLMHKCIVNNIVTRVFCGFYLGFLAWRAVVQGRGRGIPRSNARKMMWSTKLATCLLWQILSIARLFIYDSSKRVQRVVPCTHHTGQYQGSCISLCTPASGRQFSKAMKGDIQQRAQKPSVMHGKVKLPRCRGVKAGGSQQTRLNTWDVF